MHRLMHANRSRKMFLTASKGAFVTDYADLARQAYPYSIPVDMPDNTAGQPQHARPTDDRSLANVAQRGT